MSQAGDNGLLISSARVLKASVVSYLMDNAIRIRGNETFDRLMNAAIAEYRKGSGEFRPINGAPMYAAAMMALAASATLNPQLASAQTATSSAIQAATCSSAARPSRSRSSSPRPRGTLPNVAALGRLAMGLTVEEQQRSSAYNLK